MAGEPTEVEVIDDEAAVMEQTEMPAEVDGTVPEDVVAIDGEGELVDEVIASAAELTGMTEEELGEVLVDYNEEDIVATFEEEAIEADTGLGEG